MLKNKVAVVTGGTRGIGYATVKKFLENGAAVVLFGSRQETVDKALASLKAENPAWEVYGAWPDLADAEAVAGEIGKVKETLGKIDILVNNAGMSDSTPIDNYTAQQFAKVMQLNVSAMMNCIMPTVKIMKEQGGGCILNTSSMVSICGQPPDVAWAKLACQRPGKPVHGRFACGVSHARVLATDADQGAGIQDASSSLLFHDLHCGNDAVHHGAYI